MASTHSIGWVNRPAWAASEISMNSPRGIAAAAAIPAVGGKNRSCSKHAISTGTVISAQRAM